VTVSGQRPSHAGGDAPQQFGNLAANLRFIDETGALSTPAAVLEVGTGTGGMLHALRSRGHRAAGVELRHAFIAQARAHYGPMPIAQVNGVALPFKDGSFDAVVTFDVFEHIPDSDGHLREAHRVLRPGGSYLIQTPNRWTNAIFETIRWRSFTRWRADHCSLHSLGELTARLERHGFGRVRPYAIPVVNDFFRAKVRRHLGVAGVAALRIANPDRWPLRLRTNLYVSAIKEPTRA
jgi:SAM-dependent methyltransferase